MHFVITEDSWPVCSTINTIVIKKKKINMIWVYIFILCDF